jgi:hypothetical protein
MDVVEHLVRTDKLSEISGGNGIRLDRPDRISVQS